MNALFLKTYKIAKQLRAQNVCTIVLKSSVLQSWSKDYYQESLVENILFPKQARLFLMFKRNCRILSKRVEFGLAYQAGIVMKKEYFI